VDEFQQLPHMPVGRLLALAERLAADKRLLEESLNVLTSWLRDLLLVRYYPSGVVHRDLLERLRQQAAQLPVEDLMAHIQALRQAQADLRGNVGARLVAETLLLQLAPRSAAGAA